MKPSLMLLNWFWWRYRFLLVGCVCSVFVAQLVYWSGVLLQVEDLKPWSILLNCATFAVFATALTVFSHGADLDLTSGNSALPRWLTYLPIRNHSISIVPIAAMIVAFTFAWFPFVLTTIHFLGTQTDVSSWGINRTDCIIYFVILPWVYFCAIGLWVQANSWFSFKFAAFRVISLFGFVYLLISAIVRLTDVEYDADVYSSYSQAVIVERGWMLVALSPIVLLVCGILAVWSISQSRQRSTVAESEWSGNVWGKIVTSTQGIIAAFSPTVDENSEPFESNQQAIQWRDWKRLGQYPCWAMLFLSLFLLYCKAGPALFPVAFLTCAMAGTLMGKNKYWKGYMPFSPFLGTLPVTNKTFLRMRFVNAFRVAVVCWGIAGAGFLVYFLSAENRGFLQAASVYMSNVLGAEYGDLPFGINILLALLLLFFVLTVAAPFPGMAVGLCGRRSIHIAYSITAAFSTVIGLIVLFAILGRISMQLGSPEMAESSDAKQQYIDSLFNWIFAWCCAFLIFKIALAGGAVYLQLKRGIFCGRSLLKYGCLFAVAYVFLGGAFWLLLHETDFHFRWIPLWLGILFPFVSMLLAPVSLDWNRHR